MAPSEDDGVESQTERTQAQPAVTEPPVLRPLTSLRWPYIPEEPSYPDPLAKEEAKPLQLLQYEAIGKSQTPRSRNPSTYSSDYNVLGEATSRKIREIFATHPGLKDRLRAIDALQGDQRSWELEKVLGVAVGADGRIIGGGGSKEDMEALRALAEAVEEVSRGEQGVGLDWGEEG